jgi:two-component system LytT family sensor kinase
VGASLTLHEWGGVCPGPFGRRHLILAHGFNGASHLWPHLIYGLIWLLLTPVVFWLAASFGLTAGPRGRLVALLVHASASVGLTVFFRVLYVAGLVLVGAPSVIFSWATVLASVNVWLPGYWMLLCVAYALNFYARYHRRNLDAAHLEMQLLQAQLQALKCSFSPTFCLTRSMPLPRSSTTSRARPQRMTAKLVEFLRLVLDNTDEHQVTLAQELHFAEL